jgi:hypothetical protein
MTHNNIAFVLEISQLQPVLIWEKCYGCILYRKTTAFLRFPFNI